MRAFRMSKLTLSEHVFYGNVCQPSTTPDRYGALHGYLKCVFDTQAADLVQDFQFLNCCMNPARAEQVLELDYVSQSYTLLRGPRGSFQLRDVVPSYCSDVG